MSSTLELVAAPDFWTFISVEVRYTTDSLYINCNKSSAISTTMAFKAIQLSIWNHNAYYVIKLVTHLAFRLLFIYHSFSTHSICYFFSLQIENNRIKSNKEQIVCFTRQCIWNCILTKLFERIRFAYCICSATKFYWCLF